MTAEVEAAATKEFSAETKELGDKIAGLTLLQAKDLSDYLKEQYDIEPAAGGAVMMAGPAGGAGGDAADEGPSAVTVMLENGGQQKIQVIKAVREITGLGLKDAKALVDGAPAAVKEDIDAEEADKIKEQLEAAGATVEIK
ncbi:MAG: 50S ribosomal protein L7/L12 [Planctomycetota bacterium]|jgi:large subunit ribosomal protein L7/L12